MTTDIPDDLASPDAPGEVAEVAPPPASTGIGRSGTLISRDDDDERDDAPPTARRTRKWIAVGAVAAVAAVGAVVLVAQPWKSDDRAAAPTTDGDGDEPDRTTGVDVTVPEAEVSNRWLLDPMPEGFRLTGVFDPSMQGDIGGPAIDPLPFNGTIRQTIYTTADGSFDDGPWVSASATLLDRFERRNFNPLNYVDPSQFRPVEVQGFDGIIGDSFDGSRVIVFGPVNDGFAVSVSAQGIEDDDLLAIAEELIVEEDGDTGTAVFGPTVGELGLEPLIEFESPNWGGVSIGLQFPGITGEGVGTTSISYSAEDESDFVGITIQPPTTYDPLTLANFMLSDAEPVDVRGGKGIIGSAPDQFGFGSAVVWQEGGRTFGISGSVDADELVALANTLTEVDERAWQEAIDQTNQPFQPEAVPTWIIGVGDFEDGGATWTVELGFDADGNARTCAFTNTSDFGSTSSCSDELTFDGPQISQGPAVGWNNGSVTVVATVPADVQGAILRYTADDGIITDVPLRLVRPDWPVQAAAYAPNGPGTAELILPDGSAADSISFDDTDEFGSEQPVFDGRAGFEGVPETAAPAG